MGGSSPSRRNGTRVYCYYGLLLWTSLLSSVCHSWSSRVRPTRRTVLSEVAAAGFLVTTSPLVLPGPSDAVTSSDAPSSSSLLLDMIPAMSCGAPATTATLTRDLSVKIEQAASSLETSKNKRTTSNNAISLQLSGSWRLVYSNAPEIARLAQSFPLGFCLGKTYQPLDTAQAGFFENRAPLEHPWHIGKLMVTVVGDVRVAPRGSLNAVQVVNDANNRVEVDFRAITFELKEFLGWKVPPHFLEKSLIPKTTSSTTKAPPANDITYLDTTTRVVRGGDGSLFVFRREPEEQPMLTRSEREELFGRQQQRGKGQDVDVGMGVVEGSQSPELRFLFRERRP